MVIAAFLGDQPELDAALDSVCCDSVPKWQAVSVSKGQLPPSLPFFKETSSACDE